ncbi:MAG: hypothetical protein GVY36_07795 [Verrucomicrobia bacterium]|jgi:hypothetical protein|nr:hypothetical protein [Verrucomicrobiota bacterium]
MKTFNTTLILFATLFVFGCATSETASTTDEAAPTAVTSADPETGPRAKTAYEGSTGSGLLMERYKTGEISGLHGRSE